MKLRNHQFSIQPRIFEGSEYVHPWYEYNYNNVALVERTGIALFLVSHLRRSSNDSHNHEEGGRINLSQLRGSHSIAQISDNLVGLERNQQSADGRSPTTLRILKNRYSGETGTCGELTYDINTCRFTENETTQPPIFNPATDF